MNEAPKFRLKPTGRYYGMSWSDNDYVVLDKTRACVGRIFLSPHSPADRTWMWTIADMRRKHSIHDHGYSMTREDAMSDFARQWLAA